MIVFRDEDPEALPRIETVLQSVKQKPSLTFSPAAEE